MSLGKTDYLLHALLDNGLVKVRNIKRNDNKMVYAYLLTSAGLREKLNLMRRFIVFKEGAFEQLRASIAALRAEVDGANSNGRQP